MSEDLTAARYSLADVLSMRGIELGEQCTRCNGFGVIAYGSTSTWRGGIGGSAITNDVCNSCWGSGNKHRPWLNLKTLKKP